LIFLPSSSSVLGMTAMQTATITNRLKAAEPTIVKAPSSLAKPFCRKRSITDKKISGAEEPRAIRDRLATVSFQTFGVLMPPWRSLTFHR